MSYFYLLLKMKSFWIIIAILSFYGVQAEEYDPKKVAKIIKDLMELTRPSCADKLEREEDDLKDFEQRYKENKFQESDPVEYGGYVGCILNEWNMLTDDGQMNQNKFNDYEKALKDNKEGLEKIKSLREKLEELLRGSPDLAESGRRLIEAKIKYKNNDDESLLI